MRLTLRTIIAGLWATLAPACSSLGGVELQDGAGEGRFTAGDDGDPSDGGPYDPTPDTSPEEDESGGSGTGADRPLEPPAATTDEGGSTGDDESDAGTDSASATAAPTSSDTGGLDEGTTSDEPQTNGMEDASSTASGTSGADDSDDACGGLDCLPPCEPDVCGQPCDADVPDGTACAGEGGAVVTCDMGVWTCAA